MCILCFEIFDQLHDELVLVLDEYVHLPLVLNFVDFEITFIGFGLKKLAINLCIRLIILHLLLWTEIGEVYKGRVTLSMGERVHFVPKYFALYSLLNPIKERMLRSFQNTKN